MPKKDTSFKGPDDVRKRANGYLYLRLYSARAGEVWRSLKTKTLDKATRERIERIKEDFYSPPQGGPAAYKYAKIAEDCYAVKMEGNRARTQEEARRIYDQLIEAFGHLDVEEVTDVAWLKQVFKWKRTTTRKKFAHIAIYARQIDRYAREQGLKRAKSDFPISDAPAKQGRVLSGAEIEKILEATERIHKTKNRHMVRLFILFGRHMGMRKTEILGLEWDRVDFERREITLGAINVKTGSRTGRGRTLRIAPEVFGPLVEWHRKYPEILGKNAVPFVFPAPGCRAPAKDIKNSLWAIAEETGVDFTAHDLRHTFYTVKLMVEKKNVVAVSEYGGTSVTTLQKVYLHSKAEHTAGVVE